MQVDPPLKEEDVVERLGFAENRLGEVTHLNGGDLAGAEGSQRQQLVQEFFFHLVGATEVLAQLVNEKRALGVNSEEATLSRVAKELPPADPIKVKIASLYARTKGKEVPPDPYTFNAYVFRILNYRHQVTHRRRNPFVFRVGGGPRASFFIDPRNRSRNGSNRLALDEMRIMFELVRSRCKEVLELL